MTTLILKRATLSRPSGTWSDDDYDVFDGDQHIGRIMWTHAASRDTPWFWSITARVPQYQHDRGYAASREQAMADFKVRLNAYSATADVTRFTVSLMVTWDICETSVVSSGIAASYEELQCKLTFLNWPISTNAFTTPSTNCESNKG